MIPRSSPQASSRHPLAAIMVTARSELVAFWLQPKAEPGISSSSARATRRPGRKIVRDPAPRLYMRDRRARHARRHGRRPQDAMDRHRGIAVADMDSSIPPTLRRRHSRARRALSRAISPWMTPTPSPWFPSNRRDQSHSRRTNAPRPRRELVLRSRQKSVISLQSLVVIKGSTYTVRRGADSSSFFELKCSGQL